MVGRLRLLQGQLILQQVATTSGYGDYGVVTSGFGWLWVVMGGIGVVILFNYSTKAGCFYLEN